MAGPTLRKMFNTVQSLSVGRAGGEEFFCFALGLKREKDVFPLKMLGELGDGEGSERGENIITI